jgi:hypothetical protein
MADSGSQEGKLRIDLLEAKEIRLIDENGAAVQDILKAFSLMDEEANRQGKSQLMRIVSMLTRLIQRTDRVTDAGIEYECRDAEYE